MKGICGQRSIAGGRHRDAPGFMPVNTAANGAYENSGDVLAGNLEVRLAHSVADGFRHRYAGGARESGPRLK